MNTVAILGRTTSQIELRTTQSGKSIVRFTLAVARRFDKEKTDFIDVLAWNKTAELLSKYVQKGQQIAIQGSIQTGIYEKDGIKRKTFEIVADNVSFCGSKNESNSNTSDDVDIEVSDDFDEFDMSEDVPF